MQQASTITTYHRCQKVGLHHEPDCSPTLFPGLFHKGFSQSGTALLSWALSKKPLEKTRKLAYHLDCTRSSSLEMAKCLRNVPAHALVGKLPELMRLGSTVPFAIFGPVVEKGPGAFLPDHPYTLLKEGKVYDVPWVCSSTKDEGGFPTACKCRF